MDEDNKRKRRNIIFLIIFSISLCAAIIFHNQSNRINDLSALLPTMLSWIFYTFTILAVLAWLIRSFMASELKSTQPLAYSMLMAVLTVAAATMFSVFIMLLVALF